MKITKISYRMNNPQPGYKTEHAEVEVSLTATDNPEDAANFAKAECRKILGLDVSEEDIQIAERLLERARKAGLR